MDTKSVFASSMLAVVILNLLMSSIYKSVERIALESLTGFVSGIVLVGIIMGVSVLSFSLSETIQTTMLGLLIIINLLFQLDIGTFTVLGQTFTFSVGLGLISNLLDIFAGGDFFGLGLILCGTLSVIIFISGVYSVVNR